MISARCVDSTTALGGLSRKVRGRGKNVKTLFHKEVWSKVVRSRDDMDDRFFFIFVTSQQDTVFQSMDAKKQLKTSTTA